MSDRIKVSQMISVFLEGIEEDKQVFNNDLSLLKSIVKSPQLWKEVEDIASGKVGDISEELYELLFNSKFASKMPYGTQKARTGDPYNWLIAKIRKAIK